MGDYLYIKTGECYSKRSQCLFYGELNMFKLSDKIRMVFALLGVASKPHPQQHQNQARCGRGRRVEICRTI